VALKDVYFGKVELGMSNRKSSTWMARLVPSAAQLYINEVTQTLKDATPVGQLFLSVEDLSRGTLISKGVELKTYDDAADYPLPTLGVYAFDKFGTSFAAGFGNYQNTIPGRDMAAVALGPDGITILIAGTGATTQVTQYVSRFNAVVLGVNDAAAAVTQMLVVS
jgi:hypothetical protein